jgi:hypothetical protein
MEVERVGVGCCCTSVVSLSPAKNDFFLGPFDMKNGFDVKCKNPKKSFCQKSSFFTLIIHEKNDFFGKKPFYGQKPFFIFSV